MINLIKFWEDNHYKKNNRYYKKIEENHTSKNDTNNLDDRDYKTSEQNEKEYLYDSDDSIKTRFKELLDPDYSEESDIKIREQNEMEYLYICYYLWLNNYCIPNQPNVFKNPNYHKYANRTIRMKAMEEYGDENGRVTWVSRRRYIENKLLIKKTSSSILLDNELGKLIEEISTNNRNFTEMTNDEKLQNIRNAYEHISEKFGGYKKIKFQTIFLGYLSEENITEFSKKLHIFRHGNEKSLSERSELPEGDKEYMIDIGITLIKRLFQCYKEEKKSAI